MSGLCPCILLHAWLACKFPTTGADRYVKTYCSFSAFWEFLGSFLVFKARTWYYLIKCVIGGCILWEFNLPFLNALTLDVVLVFSLQGKNLSIHLLVNILILLCLEASHLWEGVHILLLHQPADFQGQQVILHLVGIHQHLGGILELLSLVGCQLILEVMHQYIVYFYCSWMLPCLVIWEPQTRKETWPCYCCCPIL